MEKKRVKYRKLGKHDQGAELNRNLYSVTTMDGRTVVGPSSHVVKGILKTERDKERASASRPG